MAEDITTSRIITYLTCPCGHRGSIVESSYDDSRSHWYLATHVSVIRRIQFEERLARASGKQAEITECSKGGSDSFRYQGGETRSIRNGRPDQIVSAPGIYATAAPES